MHKGWGSLLRSRKGAQTVEYVIVFVAIVLLAGVLYNFLSGGELQQTLMSKIEQIIAGDVSGGNSSSEGKQPPKPKPDKKPEPEKKDPSLWDKIVDNPYVQEGTNFVLDSVPVVSNIKAGYEVVSGKDIFGNELSKTDRAVSAAGLVIPGVKHAKRGVKIADKGLDMVKGGKKGKKGAKRKGCAANEDCPPGKGSSNLSKEKKDELKNKIIPASSVKWKGFRKGSLKEHYEKHGWEFGDISQKEYLDMAKDFASESGSVFKETNVGNLVIKYDPNTRRTFIGHVKSREIRTFYKADHRDEDPFEAAVKLAKELSGK